MKKVAIVGTVGIPACYGGFESLVENLTLNSGGGIKYRVYCSSRSYDKKLVCHNDADLTYIPLKANGVQSILYDTLSLMSCWFKRPDVVVVLGVSGCMFLPTFKTFSKSRVVTNIDGLEWKRDKWGKWTRRFLKWSESIAVRYSDVVVTDNKAIEDYVKNEYGVKSETIAYGGDHAIRDLAVSSDRQPYALGLCRIEPENNVAMILEAYSNLDVHLKFVGNWDASDYGRNLRKKFINCSNIELLDPIYDLDALYQLRKGCSIYLHGHSAGGTNPSLVEMMHFGVPIFAFDCSFNRYSTDSKAFYFSSSGDLITILASVTPEELTTNMTSMTEIAKERYTWAKISEEYKRTYNI